MKQIKITSLFCFRKEKLGQRIVIKRRNLNLNVICSIDFIYTFIVDTLLHCVNSNEEEETTNGVATC